MSEVVRSSTIVRSGIYSWKEVLVRVTDSQFIGPDGDLMTEVEVPLLIEDKGGYLQPGIVKEFIYQKVRIGELYGYKEPGTTKIHIGFSLIHPIDVNCYCKATGVELAATVADKSFDVKPVIPSHARESIAYFVDRCQRYFRSTDVPKWAGELKEKYCPEVY